MEIVIVPIVRGAKQSKPTYPPYPFLAEAMRITKTVWIYVRRSIPADTPGRARSLANGARPITQPNRLNRPEKEQVYSPDNIVEYVSVVTQVCASVGNSRKGREVGNMTWPGMSVNQSRQSVSRTGE